VVSLRRLLVAGAALLASSTLQQTVAKSATGEPVEATATLTPQTALFGDRVTARVEAIVDATRVDPRSVRLVPAFAPYEQVDAVERTERDASGVAYVRWTVELRCLTGPCTPGDRSQKRFTFTRAHVEYGTPARRLALVWPPLDVYTRLDQAALARRNPRDIAPWRGDPTALPAVSYAIAPGLLRGLLIGFGLLFALCGLALASRLLPRRATRRLGRSAPVGTRLERALAGLEAARARGRPDEQRRALERLARELELDGEPPLAARARELAWDAPPPPGEATRALAAGIRALLEVRGNGRAS